MALKKCTECGKEISEFAKVCPNCGHNEQRMFLTDRSKARERYKATGTLLTKIAIALLAVGAVLAIWAAFQYKVISGEGYHLKASINWLLGLLILTFSGFQSAICYGLGKLISAKAEF